MYMVRVFIFNFLVLSQGVFAGILCFKSAGDPRDLIVCDEDNKGVDTVIESAYEMLLVKYNVENCKECITYLDACEYIVHDLLDSKKPYVYAILKKMYHSVDALLRGIITFRTLQQLHGDCAVLAEQGLRSDLMALDENGTTVLERICKDSNQGTALVRLLVACFPESVSLPNAEGKTAVMVLRENENSDLCVCAKIYELMNSVPLNDTTSRYAVFLYGNICNAGFDASVVQKIMHTTHFWEYMMKNNLYLNHSITAAVTYEYQQAALLCKKCLRADKIGYEQVPQKIVYLADYLYKQHSGGDSLMHYACCQDYVEFLCLLLDCGFQVDVRNARGDTPAHVAAASSCVAKYDILSELDVVGADFDLRNDQGERPVDIVVFKRDSASIAKAAFLMKCLNFTKHHIFKLPVVCNKKKQVRKYMIKNRLTQPLHVIIPDQAAELSQQLHCSLQAQRKV